MVRRRLLSVGVISIAALCAQAAQAEILIGVAGAMTGPYAAVGMNMIQWAGAAAAVLGSVTIAVAVRVWPAKEVEAD